MPEGDTLARTADGLRPYLVGREVVGARARGGAQVARLVGSRVESVEAIGKNLLMRFSNGLEVRTHLRMKGSWHRYRPGEAWRRPPARAVLVVEVPGAVAVCFDAPVVELFEARSEPLHPQLSALGPDVLKPDFDPAEAIRRLRDPGRASMSVGEALVDQGALAGIGNIYRCEALFAERVSPFVALAAVSDQVLEKLVATARRMLAANASRDRPAPTTTGRRGVGDTRFWVYRRSGRPCRRCGALIRSGPLGRDLPRTVYWCPSCQAGDGLAEAKD
jgi:endonuclease-8